MGEHYVTNPPNAANGNQLGTGKYAAATSEASSCSLSVAAAECSAGDIIWVKKANYSNIDTINVVQNATSGIEFSVDGTAAQPIFVVGYTNTPGDAVSADDGPFLDATGGSSGSASAWRVNGAYYRLKYLRGHNNPNSDTRAFALAGGALRGIFYKCDGYGSQGASGAATFDIGALGTATYATLIDCNAFDANDYLPGVSVDGRAGYRMKDHTAKMYGCTAQGFAGAGRYGFDLDGYEADSPYRTYYELYNCVAYNCAEGFTCSFGGSSVATQYGASLWNCYADTCISGFRIEDWGMRLYHCLAANCTTGIDGSGVGPPATGIDQNVLTDKLGLYNNGTDIVLTGGSGDLVRVQIHPSEDVAIGAEPLTDAANGDFSLSPAAIAKGFLKYESAPPSVRGFGQRNARIRGALVR